MRAILVIAHGSRRAASNQEVVALTAALRQRLQPSTPLVEAAFLELAEPLIGAGLEQLIAQGATEITLFPYFLAAGRHVIHDIPAEVAPVAARYPAVTIQSASHLGAAPQLIELIATLLSGVVAD